MLTDRTRLRRKAERGSHDRAVIDAILDEALICHVGFAHDGHPSVIPMIHARVGDHFYLHGAAGNHLLRSLASGIEACVTVTQLDGLVLARSAFHHSVNYRSVVIFGVAERVDDPGEKRAAVDALVEHVVRGRSADTRPPTPEELRATLVVRLPLSEASAKIRTGGPIEEPGDLELPHWAGELPLALTAAAPVPDAGVRAPVPDYLRTWSRTALASERGATHP
jgi:nitroimidazol reductase NimA-like FMN-containing flavoprotein (pyridoxamine 5'-phosphate oxidase superfamily)